MGEKKLSNDRKFFNDCESRMMVSSPGAKHLVELQQKAQVEVIAPCLHAGLDWVSPLGIYRTFPEPMTFEGRTNDWVVFPLQHDPLFKQGRFPMPEDILLSLLQLKSIGITFPYIYIAHELPKNAKFLPTKEMLAPPPRDVVRLSEKVGEWSEKMLDLTKSVLKIGATVAATTVAVAPALLAFPIVDPVLFGAISLHGESKRIEPAYYFKLAEWEW